MLLPKREAHIVLSTIWALALLPLYVVSDSLIASTALLFTAITTAIMWPSIWDLLLKSKNATIAYWVCEYKFYEFAMMAASLKTEKKQRKVSP